MSTNANSSGFTCACKEWMRPACEREPFYKEHEGKMYCVLHFPSEKKFELFAKVLEKKLEIKDFNFSGAWFPGEFSFSYFHFSERTQFSAAVFLGEADFSDTVFDEWASFLSAVFYSRADFAAARFNGSADFRNTRFGGRADFLHTIFEAKASFNRTFFRGQADFASARFNEEVNFSGATFYGQTFFSNATFGDYVRFSSDDDLTFHRREIGQPFVDTSLVDFQYIRTEKPDRISFHTLTLHPHWFVNVDTRKFDFTNVEWRGSLNREIEYLKFRNVDLSLFQVDSFKNGPRLAHKLATKADPLAAFLQGQLSAEIQQLLEQCVKNSRITKECLIALVDGLNKILTGSSLYTEERFKRIRLKEKTKQQLAQQPRDEKLVRLNRILLEDAYPGEIAKSREVSPPHRLLAIACRQIAVNAEENHRYEESSRFRYMAMDARRLEWLEKLRGISFIKNQWRTLKKTLVRLNWSLRRDWGVNDRTLTRSKRFLIVYWKSVDLLHWLYWAASGYGERVARAFMVLIGIWLIFACFYTQVGFNRAEQKLTSESDVAATKTGEVAPLRPFLRAVAYSAAVMILQKPEPRPITTTAQSVVILETILGPLQGTLLALAIRRRFMR